MVLLFNKYIVCFDLFFTFAAEKVIDVCFHRHDKYRQVLAWAIARIT